jgi:adenylate cyclase class IV
MKKEIEFKAWIDNSKEILKQLKQYGNLERCSVTQNIYKSEKLDYFARIAVFTYPKGIRKSFLTLKKDLMKSEKGLVEGEIVIQDEIETEFPIKEIRFYTEMLQVLGLVMVHNRQFIKNKICINDTVVTIDEVNGKYHLEIESSSVAKINKVRKLLGI